MADFQIAHYRITGELGRGGMGIVYRAEDTKLDRTVALKVLPPHALASEDDRARFYREARAAAKLSHAHICHVYQVDEAVLVEEGKTPGPDAEKRPFIAMEFVDGESLAERIVKGPLKLDEAIRLATEIAEALGVAHEAGVVHRDIKSGNVMLTAKGKAKVLDFGLAKTAASTQLTRQGSTLGTVAYMSPEQARGEEVDRRTDLWALGVVLYEMIAGKLPFAADYEQAALYGILNEDPEPLTAVRTGVPMELEAVVAKLLRKDVRHRYQSAAGLVADLGVMNQPQSAVRSAVHSSVRSVAAPVTDSGPTRRLPTWPVTVSIAAVTLILGFLGASLKRSEPEPTPDPMLSLRLPLRDDQRPLGVRLHPDNRHVIIASGDSTDSTPQIVIVDMETGGQRVLTGTLDVRAFDISPDGEWVLFGTGFYLAMVPFEGGEPTRLVDSQEVAAVSWGPDDSMLYTAGRTTYRLRDVTSEPEELVGASFSDGVTGYFMPDWVESTSYVLLSRQRGPNINNTDSLDLVLLNVTNGDRRILLEGACCGHVLDSGHILYNRGGSMQSGGSQLIVQPFDLDSMVPEGRPIALPGGGGPGQYDIGSNGTFVRLGGDRGAAGTLSLVLLDIGSGTEQVLPYGAEFFQTVRWSPDGRQVMGQIAPPSASAYIAVYDIGAGTSQRVSVTSLDMFSPAWAPDGTRAIAALPAGAAGVNGDLYTFSTDGSGGIEPLLESEETSFNWPDWSPDGRFVVMRGRNQQTQSEQIWSVDVKTGEGRNLRQDPGLDRLPRISPDSRLITYQKSLDGALSVWAMTADGSDHWLVAQDAGAPVWSADGSSIFFQRRNSVYRIPVEYRNGFRTTGTPTEVFHTDYQFGYDLSPDGTRFILMAAMEDAASNAQELEVIVNWTSRLPAAR